MPDISKLLYCTLSTLYVNAIFTNMCYQKLHFLEQLGIFLYATILYYVLSPAYAPLIIPVLIVSIYLYIIFRQKHPFINAIGISLNYILSVVINYLLIGILYVMKLNIESISSSLRDMAVFCIIQTIIMYIVSGIAGHIFRTTLIPHITFFRPFKHTDKSQAKVICLVAIEILIYGCVFLFNVMYGNYIGYHTATLIFNGMLFLILFLSGSLILVFLYRTLVEDYQLRLQMEEMQYIKEYSEKLEGLYKEVRSFKHNYMNILSSMYSYLDEQRYDELTDYFEKIVLPEGQQLTSETAFLGQLQNLQIPELKGIIYIKLMTASSRQLHIHTDIPFPVTNLQMNTQDLINIIGIYLNNAIEAAEQTLEKELSLSLICHTDYCTIHIANSSAPVEHISLLFTAEYSTKENHSGIGLYDAQKILNLYENVLSHTEYRDGVFSQTLQIPIQA